jgi:signal transduction histidine kinase
MEFEETLPDGEGARVFLTLKFPLLDPAGIPYAIGGVTTEITERKRMEEDLHREREFLKAVLDNIGEGVVACDADGRLNFFNQAAREFHQQDEQPLPPDQWAECYGLFDCDGSTPMRQEDIPLYRANRGERVRDAELVIAPRQGPVRRLIVNGQALFNADGHKLGAVVTMHDVTELKRAEEARARLLAQLMTAQEDERRGIARDLHDGIGQALTSVLVGLRAVEDAPTLDTARERLGELRRITAATIDEVRRLARGLRPCVLDDLGLGPALANFVEDFSRVHGIAVDLQAEPLAAGRLPRLVETALYRIVQEALTNVARHAHARSVTVAIARHASSIQAIISDDGRGFDVETLEQAVGARGHFGLSGIRERATLLDGSATIQSEPGVGTQVCVIIPLADESHAEDPGAHRR